MRHRRRRVRVPPDLTSLFDVLFIVIFAALIRAAAVQAAAQPKPLPPPAPPVALDPASLRARALAEVATTRQTAIVRVSATGTITAIEVGGKALAVDAPLLEHSPDPDIAIAYLGDRSTELRVCRIAALHLGVPDLAQLPRGRGPRAAARGPAARALRRTPPRSRSLPQRAARDRRARRPDRNAMTDLARDVAKELDRRQRRRTWLFRGALVAVVVAAVLYLRCGAGWGLGGAGAGSGSGSGARLADAGPHRCAIRVAASGITVDGKPATREECVARCAATHGAEIVVTGDAREGDWEQLRAALEAARIPMALH